MGSRSGALPILLPNRGTIEVSPQLLPRGNAGTWPKYGGGTPQDWSASTVLPYKVRGQAKLVLPLNALTSSARLPCSCSDCCSSSSWPRSSSTSCWLSLAVGQIGGGGEEKVVSS